MIIRIPAILDRFEKKEAVLKTDSNQELRVAKEELWQPEAGQEYVLQVMPKDEAELDQQELARTILNQLLIPDDSQTSSQSGR